MLTPIQRLLDGDVKIGTNVNWVRVWFEWFRNGSRSVGEQGFAHDGVDGGLDPQQNGMLPMHSDWLFSACEPRIADLVQRVDARLPERMERPTRVLQFIGAQRGVGASTIAFAYASASAALRQRKVLLLSADEIQAKPGVLACVSEGRPAGDGVSRLHGTLFHGALAAGDNACDAPKMLANAAIWAGICDGFDEVVVDCRPIDISLVALAIAPRADGVIAVLQAERTPEQCARGMLEALRAVNAPVLGVVLNQGTVDLPFGLQNDDE